MAVSFDQELCLGCICCVDACDYFALLLQPSSGNAFEKVVVDEDACTECSDCVVLCASGALTSPE